MDLPGWKINLLTENAIRIMEEKQKELHELQDEITNNENNISNDITSNIAELKDIG